MKIQDLSVDARPRELAAKFGEGSLQDVQLLAILIGKGTPKSSALDIANRMLYESGGLLSLSTYTKEELMRFDGIGQVKATELLAVFELFRRLKHKGNGLPTSSSIDDVSDYYRKSNMLQEEARILLLSHSNRPIGSRLLYQGGIASLPLHIDDVLRLVLSSGSKRFILLHNHPSGNPLPSLEDIKSLTGLEIACKKVGVTMVDFLIIGEERSFSLQREKTFDV